MRWLIVALCLGLICIQPRICLSQDNLVSELIFPLHHEHNHCAGIAELANGELIVSWYRGSGERKADDVCRVWSATRDRAKAWSEPFLMVDTPGFPDGNTCMMVDERGQFNVVLPLFSRTLGSRV